ncbi:MAG TPA: DUF411 domain-containing protein [Gemmatimonadales bacterium]|nr:DUF411 domain-containing protein [Gemmatimonadales bacterium]
MKRVPVTPLVVAAAFVATLGAALPAPRSAAPPTEITVYHSPTCECCKRWISYLKENGFAVKSIEQEDLAEIKAELGVIPKVQSCHTALVQGYVIEGHVPVEDIRRLLREKPHVVGLAAPGMPASAPGMDMGRSPYEVVAFSAKGDVTEWARH